MLARGMRLARAAAAARGPSRGLCAEADTALRNAYFLLGMPAGSPRRAIKHAYYALAKQTHPDAIGPTEARAEHETVVKDFSSASKGLMDEPTGPAAADRFLEVRAPLPPPPCAHALHRTPSRGRRSSRRSSC